MSAAIEDYEVYEFYQVHKVHKVHKVYEVYEVRKVHKVHDVHCEEACHASSMHVLESLWVHADPMAHSCVRHA